MALYDLAWYCNSVGYAAVAPWAASTAVAVGALRRQLTTPAVNSERVFVCIVAGTTGTTEPTWVLTRGAKTTDVVVTWMECTGIAALNSDISNTVNWTQAKASGSSPSLGALIQRNNGASYQICTTAGSLGAAEPAFSDTAGTTTAESGGTAVWTSLGVVGNWTTKGAAPHARLSNVFLLGFIPGNTAYVGDNHAESQATALTITVPNAAATASGNKILCHNHSGNYPPASGDLATSATITDTGAVNFTLSGAGPTYIYGITFQCSGSFMSFGSSTYGLTFENCSLQALSASSSTIEFGGGAGTATTLFLINTTVKFGAANSGINLQGANVSWSKTAPILASGSVVLTTGFFNLNLLGTISNFIGEGLDVSAIAAPLVGFANPMLGNFMFKDCKINAAMPVPVIQNSGFMLQFVRCDSGAAAYKSARYTYEGSETTELSVVRTGGAIDPTGVAQSRKITNGANMQWTRPFKAEPYAMWNAVTAATVTVTMYGYVNDAVLPLNDELWLELEYLGSSAAPLGSIVTTTKANIAAVGAALAADTSSWDGAATARVNSFNYSTLGIGTPIKVSSNPGRVFFLTAGSISAASLPGAYASAVDGTVVTDGLATFRAGCRFKIVASLSSPQPALAGYIHVRVRSAKPSTTYYVDPQINLS